MKKVLFKILISTVIILLIILLITTLVFLHSEKPKNPFKNLNDSNVKNVYIDLGVYGTFAVTESEKTEFLSLLHDVVIYEANLKANKDPNDAENFFIGGMPQEFTVELTSGYKFTVDPKNPYFIINDIWFKTEYAACDALSNYHSELQSRYHPVG